MTGEKSFLSMLITGGTLVLADDTPHELITGSAGQLHRTSTALGRSVRATRLEATKPLPGDDLIVDAKGSLTHAITIQRAPCDVWPWLAQMGAGSRAGWYSYDFLDNQGQPSASRIVPELQRLSIGMLFPALPGATDGFTLLAFKPNRFLVIGWPSPAGGAPLMTWAFVLEDTPIGVTRLVVRARVGADYGFHKLPWWIGNPVARVVHFVMQRKQLLGIARRAQRCAGDPASTTPPVESSHERNAAA